MILYRGKSRIDGKPIVAIATIGSNNPKTGPMVQTWIERSDISPVKAVQTGGDKSICGGCKHRHNLKGACYVKPFQAPLAVYKRFKRRGYQAKKNVAMVTKALAESPIRFGAYGDPCAVPAKVWRKLIAQGCGTWTGYTHQWKLKRNQGYRGFLMASCDSLLEAQQASAMGWRVFLVVTDVAESYVKLPEVGAVVECPSIRNVTCADCGACDGTKDGAKQSAASIMIPVHGALAKRFSLNVVR